MTVTQTGRYTVYTNTSGHWSVSARHQFRKLNSTYLLSAQYSHVYSISPVFSLSRNTHNTIYSPVLRLLCRGSLVPRLCSRTRMEERG